MICGAFLGIKSLLNIKNSKKGIVSGTKKGIKRDYFFGNFTHFYAKIN